jgi:hypothetical protein
MALHLFAFTFAGPAVEFLLQAFVGGRGFVGGHKLLASGC